MIEIQNLSKTFSTADGTVEALKDISLTIADGEIYGIIGMSGAGKSTLVRSINMLERPTSGIASKTSASPWNWQASKNRKLKNGRRNF